MSDFKVGDVVERIVDSNVGKYKGRVVELCPGQVCTVIRVSRDGWPVVKWPDGELSSDPRYFRLIERPAEPAAKARTNDPGTSQAAARKPRVGLRQRLLELFQKGEKHTGHSAAAAVAAPLNSVTPRFAELRRNGYIRDSGQRSNGQIVWELSK